VLWLDCLGGGGCFFFGVFVLVFRFFGCCWGWFGVGNFGLLGGCVWGLGFLGVFVFL